MKNSSIHSEIQYCEALARLQEIFSAKTGTKEGKELDSLANAIIEYEKRHFPI